MKVLVVLALVMVAATISAQDAVPVEQEPFHKTVFKNAYVQVFRVKLEPGEITLMHIHAHDDAAVRLSNATVTSESAGQQVGAPEVDSPGMVSTRDNAARPTVHRVHNVGATLFDVMDVQILSRPAGAATEAISKPAAENATMRVYRYELAAGESSAQHAHSRPYLIVAATDATLRMTSPKGEAMEHPVKAGDIHWVETAVTHTLTNAGKEKAVFVEVELK